MKVNSIDRYYSNFKNLGLNKTKQNDATNPIMVKPLGNDSITFRGGGVSYSASHKAKIKQLENGYTVNAMEVKKIAESIAKKYNCNILEDWHLYLASLVYLNKKINDIDTNSMSNDEIFRQSMLGQVIFMADNNPDIITDDRLRKKLSVTLKKHIKKTVKTFAKQDSNEKNKKNFSLFRKPVPYSKETITNLYSTLIQNSTIESLDVVPESLFLAAGYNSKDRALSKEADTLDKDIKKILMVDSTDKRKQHLSFYDSKADVLWKNVSLGKNTIIQCDSSNQESMKHLTSSFANLIKKPDQKYSGIDPENTEIISLNHFASTNFLNDLIHDKVKEAKNGKRVVIMGDLYKMMSLDNNMISLNLVNKLGNLENSNVSCIFTITPESYYLNTAKGALLAPFLNSCSVQTLPEINVADAMKYLTDEKGIEYIKSETGKDFDSDTIKAAITMSYRDDDIYPDKAIKLLRSVSNYYPDKEKYEPSDVENFIKETKGLNEIQGRDDDETIVYDTGKGLNDIVGSPMTKAQAESVVKQIKSGTINTKGFLIYADNYSSYGGGRRHVAEAIAGEAGIPLISVNAQEFALKDIDTLSQNAGMSEIKIKKLMSMAKSSAMSNPNKTAMIFIENFDNFGSDPMYGLSSIYEQKAFSQLLYEMDKVRENDDVNIIVAGSVNMPMIINENIKKPYKFLDKIIVHQPQDSQQRKEVMEYYIDKMNLKIKGDDKERNEILNNLSDTTMGFSFVDIIYLLETAKRVSTEKNKEKIEFSDLVEAFLQTTTGRANPAYLSDEDKKIIASHEVGHAITSEIMSNIARNQGIPWFLPSELNFITLDPRGWYSGATYYKNLDKDEKNFETVMANLVYSYGGNSAEDTIYGMNGSWGISGDMHQVDQMARLAVLNMGMGPRTGVRRIPTDENGDIQVYSQNKLQNIEDDIDAFTYGAKIISDAIIEAYKDFIIEFTEKYYSKVGSGNCIISASTLREELEDWKNGLSALDKLKLAKLENNIIKTMNKVKYGKKITPIKV